MKSILLQLFAVALLFAVSVTDAQAQCFKGEDGKYYNLDGTPCINVVVTAVPFLRIVADARSGAMGDVGIGLTADPNAMHFNPSKLAFAEKKLSISAVYPPGCAHWASTTYIWPI
ncbi:MAG: hypothetical protein IPN33_22835 [Saprospiraceae bacterium]|nr:hypothetical protein [Saprospiraceae bacterium]